MTRPPGKSVAVGGKADPREKWLSQKLAFLTGHVYRVPLRSGVDVSRLSAQLTD